MSCTELNTIAPKKWEGDYSGVEPTLTRTLNDVRVGDIAIDTGTSPEKIWRCIDEDTPVWHLETYVVKEITTITAATYTASALDEVILVDTGSNAVTISLPAISGSAGRQYSIKVIDNTNAVTIDPNASETIDGNTSVQLLEAYESITVVVDDGETGWFII